MNGGILLVRHYLWAGLMKDEVMIIKELKKQAPEIDVRMFIFLP